MTPTQLKQLRLKKHVSLRYISERIGLHPNTLEDIEDGNTNAMEAVLAAWEKVIVEAPRRPVIRALDFNAATVLAVAMLLAVFLLLTVWVLR